MTADEYMSQMARAHAHWDRVPAAYREIPEGEDPQERLDELSEEEKHDRRAFQQGEAAPCVFTQMMQEEEAEQQVQLDS
jgi:hypothetical protein